eukprot:4291544-Pyramimonas_sp.AAC.1
MCFTVSPFRFRWPSKASIWLQDGPTGPRQRPMQEGPKTDPRAPKSAPRAPQERPKKGCLEPLRGEAK